MAETVISAMTSNNVPKVDPEAFKPSKNLSSLDSVVNAQNSFARNEGKQNSIQKIASFKPNQLKGFSATIEKSVTQRKQAVQVRQAIDSLTKEKVQATREENPFSKNNPLETQTGRKINLST